MLGRMGRNQPIRRPLLGIREAVGHSLHSSHLEPKEHECDVDRVGALGRARALGSALWRWRHAGDDRMALVAFKHLLRKAKSKTGVFNHHEDYPILQRACQLVLSEWYYPNCRTCGGAGEFVEDKLRIVCQECEGIGSHRFSDKERIKALGIPSHLYAKIWAARISELWLCLSTEDLRTASICRYQLERN